MGNIRNVSGQALFVPGFGILDDQDVAEVPDDTVYAYTASANFEPVGSSTEALHQAGATEEAERVAAEQAERGVAPAGDVDESSLEQPAGNAAREEWARYVVTAGLATAEELEGLGRDQIRDKFGA